MKFILKFIFFKQKSILSIFFTIYIICVGCEVQSKCHSFYPGTKSYLGTKTPYSYVANTNISINYSGCIPKRIWSLIRHGTRNPGTGFIEIMKVKLSVAKEIIVLKHSLGKGHLCQKEITELKTWSTRINTTDQKILTHEGEDEMVDMAERFQLRFSELLPERYSNLTFKFRHTATQRTEASAHYFTTGLFGRYTANHVWYPQALDKDPILRFYKLCDKWRHEVDDNPNSLNELEKFKKTNDAVEMTKRVSRRLGLDEVLPYNDVHSMYIACTFETAWTPRIPSPWCSLFTKEDLEVLEYSEDLKYYWVDGYGYEINYKQACPAIGDMIQHLTNTTLPKAVFYFTHSGTLLKVLSFLNLYNDNKKLTADNFRQNKDRKWRVSKIDVFGTNLAFILYRCGDGDKVLTMHQERPVTLPGCPQGELCPLSRILELYGNSIHSCKFNEMCAYSVPS